MVAREGINLDVVPTEQMRPVVEWALAYFRASEQAPTVQLLNERFPDLASDHGYDFGGDLEESIEWALEDLDADYVQVETGVFVRDLAQSIAKVPKEERVRVLAEHSARLSGTVMSLQSRTTQVDLRQSGPDIIGEYHLARQSQGQVQGMAFGLPQVDTHTGGIRDGEICTMAGAAGSGKSFFADLVAHNEWARGRVTTLFTLENSIAMTEMRIACMALRLSTTDLQHGDLSDADYVRLSEWCHDVLHKSDTPLNIVAPDATMRSPQAIVDTAKAYGTESLIIDQLTHVDRANDKQQSQAYDVRDKMRTLEMGISTGRHRMPCLLMHQIKREGIVAAAKTGRFHMTDMGDSADVERTSAWVFGLYASADAKAIGMMQLQGLKARRAKDKTWDLSWSPHMGLVHVHNEVVIS